MVDDGSTDDEEHPANIGDPRLPPDMTHRKMARMQGFDTTPTGPTEEEYYEQMAEAEEERRREEE